MKKLIFFLTLLLVGTGSTMNAEVNPQNDSYTIKIGYTDTNGAVNTTTLNFKSLELAKELKIDKILDTYSLPKGEDCEATVTVTVSHTFSYGVDMGVSSNHEHTITMSGSVTASCADIAGAVEDLVGQLNAVIQAQIDALR